MEKLIDVTVIGKELDVPVIAAYGPNREGPFYNQVWSKPYAQQLLESVHPNEAGDTYILTGHVDPWVFMAIIYKLQGGDIYFRVPSGDTKLEPMQRGECKYKGVFSTKTEEDDVFVTADFDKLESIVGGPAMVNLEELAVPEIPAGKNVYFHGIGKYPFQMRTAYTLMNGCKSLSCASGTAEAYTCSIPGGDVSEVGDIRPLA